MDLIKLKEILELHRQWLKNCSTGSRANLRGAKLGDANLSRANLGDADLRCANLGDAKLGCADLSRANLGDADLRGANLRGAKLGYANLGHANLGHANLGCADLGCANLGDADLRGANLRGANLGDADLRGANLRDANLRDADLSRANLPHSAVCPEEGDFVAWKKLRGDVIAKLLIPAAARRTSCLCSRKCRAEFVKVIEGEGFDKHTGKLEYKVGKIITADDFNGDIRAECTHGIHFFITRREAEEY